MDISPLTVSLENNCAAACHHYLKKIPLEKCLMVLINYVITYWTVWVYTEHWEKVDTSCTNTYNLGWEFLPWFSVMRAGYVIKERRMWAGRLVPDDCLYKLSDSLLPTEDIGLVFTNPRDTDVTPLCWWVGCKQVGSGERSEKRKEEKLSPI